MTENPKSLASVADECAKASYETYDDGQDDYSDLFRRAAAALRAPTIAVTDAEAADADSVEYANKVQSNLSRPDAFVWMIARNAYLAGRAALATPSPTIAADARPPSSEGVEAIAAERRRQVTVEGWSPQHDDAHDEGDLLAAAICYAEDAFWGPRGDPKPRDGWPWDAKWWKPKGKLRNLARAGALIAAEFDRTVRQARHGASDRLEAALATPSPTPEDSSTVEQPTLNRLTDSAEGREPKRRAFDSPSSATPTPTIAAPSPSQSNTLDLPPCPVCGETLVTRYSGPLPGCPQGISTAVCPTNPSHASQPPQASPSNEVTPEKIRVRLFQEVGGWSVTCNGHADEHVCLAASTLFNAVCAGLTTLATVYPDQIEIIEATEPSPSNEVTPEMVEAALEAFVESENVPDTRHDTEAMRLAIEAALKARKPADDGAGQ